MSSYIARHRAPRPSGRHRRSSQLTATPQQLTPQQVVPEPPTPVSLFAPQTQARTRSAT